MRTSSCGTGAAILAAGQPCTKVRRQRIGVRAFCRDRQQQGHHRAIEYVVGGDRYTEPGEGEEAHHEVNPPVPEALLRLREASGDGGQRVMGFGCRARRRDVGAIFLIAHQLTDVPTLRMQQPQQGAVEAVVERRLSGLEVPVKRAGGYGRSEDGRLGTKCL